MSRHDVTSWLTGRTARTISAVAAIAPIAVAAALASDIPAGTLKLAPDVAKEQGYETPAVKDYIVANSTNIYSDHSFTGTKVTGELKRGEQVEALAKVIGKNGTGIGYVSISNAVAAR